MWLLLKSEGFHHFRCRLYKCTLGEEKKTCGLVGFKEPILWVFETSSWYHNEFGCI